jgi:hypothetical protein
MTLGNGHWVDGGCYVAAGIVFYARAGFDGEEGLLLTTIFYVLR